jgi:methylated-DNA-[protein]-cysteine S-methyltransferase
MAKFQMIMTSKIGPFYLVATELHLTGVFWEQQNIPLIEKQNNAAAVILNNAATQLTEYLDGKRKQFDLPLDAEGTPFQMDVWRELAKIPYGKTYSYKKLAATLKNDKACRAVGSANGRNPLSIVVPCHRVIAADGTLGGFAGGLEVKRKLLELEKFGFIKP